MSLASGFGMTTCTLADVPPYYLTGRLGCGGRGEKAEGPGAKRPTGGQKAEGPGAKRPTGGQKAEEPGAKRPTGGRKAEVR